MPESPWRRHRALALLLERWPALEGDQPPARALLAEVLAGVGLGWQLASQKEVVAGYEALVVQGRIPTRDRSWHDVFNVLAFVTFPHSKAALHARCLALQQARGGAQPRSREEDALTLLDEASLLVAGPAAAIAAFEAARAGGVLAEIDQVVREQGLSAYVLGHALLEHLVLGRPPIGAGVTAIVVEPAGDREAVDHCLAERIASGGFPIPRMSPTLPWPDPLVESWLQAIA